MIDLLWSHSEKKKENTTSHVIRCSQGDQMKVKTAFYGVPMYPHWEKVDYKWQWVAAYDYEIYCAVVESQESEEIDVEVVAEC